MAVELGLENRQEQGMASGQDSSQVTQGRFCSAVPEHRVSAWRFHHQHFTQVPLHTEATTAATHFHVSGFAASSQSPGCEYPIG